jgi:outer membrane protein assembly factor BamB
VVAKKTGTALLTVKATRGEALTWEAKLPLQAVDSSGIHLAVSDDAVFTYGVKPGDTDYGVLVALEMTDGRVRFERRESSHWSTNFARTFVLNGPYLIMTWGFGVHAYDLQTGERVWNLGGR